MVYESDFSRRNYLNSCAQSGVFHASSDYKPSASLTTRFKPIGSASSTSGSGIGVPIRSTVSLSPQPDTSWRETEALASGYDSSLGRYCTCCKNCCNNGQRYCTCCKNCCGSSRGSFLSSNAMSSGEDMGSYLKRRSRSGVVLSTDSDSVIQNSRPTFSVRNVPMRSLDELRETVAIRRNYVKDRKGLYHETSGMFGPTASEKETSPSLHPAESIRSRSTISPSPVPAAVEEAAPDANGSI